MLILEELSIPYEIVSFKFDDVKKQPFIKLNPNGRVPGMIPFRMMTELRYLIIETAIEDPNTNLTLWESGAIIQVSQPSVLES